MKPELRQALSMGYDRLAAWSDVLDRINVFPIADGDTGRNLVLSLMPFREPNHSIDELQPRLLRSARGNAGNIAAHFFTGLLDRDGDLVQGVRLGRERAWKALADPLPGTMLSFFDALADELATPDQLCQPQAVAKMLNNLERTVVATSTQLEPLLRAHVVDAGALGMFIVWEGVFQFLCEHPERTISKRFDGYLSISSAVTKRPSKGFCIDAVLKTNSHKKAYRQLENRYHSVVFCDHTDFVKIHLHAQDEREAYQTLLQLGTLEQFVSDDLGLQTEQFRTHGNSSVLPIMTDAAGSVTREDANRLGMILLASYINFEKQSLPEIHLTGEFLYQAMLQGVVVSTSQASVYERHQHYQKALTLYPQGVLYLCVGSVFTGNYEVACKWKKQNDPKNKLMVIDTHASSGKLGLLALATAKFANQADTRTQVIDFAEKALHYCEEFVFLDHLKYLARGGRLSKTNAFFGDLLRMKPIVSPTPQGAKKVALIRSKPEGVAFARERLAAAVESSGPQVVMLQATDNYAWLNQSVRKELKDRFLDCAFFVQPMSLTSGAHMGPGTWAMACLPLDLWQP